jgi:hypothetical protein
MPGSERFKRLKPSCHFAATCERRAAVAILYSDSKQKEARAWDEAKWAGSGRCFVKVEADSWSCDRLGNPESRIEGSTRRDDVAVGLVAGTYILRGAKKKIKMLQLIRYISSRT